MIVDCGRSGRGLGCVKLVYVLSSAEWEHSSLFDAQDGSTYVLKPNDNACTGKNRQTRKPKHSTSTACSFPGRNTRQESRHQLLEHGAHSPRESREGRSGSVSKGVCRPMGSLSKRSPRRWSFEGLNPVCLSVACRAYVSAPKRKKKSAGRRAILGLVLAARGDVQCNMLAECGANKSDGWGVGSSAAEWSM